jgi:hypothetical protein
MEERPANSPAAGSAAAVAVVVAVSEKARDQAEEIFTPYKEIQKDR